MQIYQDIWVNGKVRQKGVRVTEARYAPIKELLSKYTRPVTILDIGANLGYFSFRASSEFNCISIMVEASKEYLRALKKLSDEQNCKDSLILLGKRLRAATLRTLAACEHFDIVLALRVVHHFKEPYSEVIRSINYLGDYIFMELPTPGETKVKSHGRVAAELSNHAEILKRYDYKKVGEYPSHVGNTLSPMYLIKSNRTTITRPYFGSHRRIKHTIVSEFGRKSLRKTEKFKKRGTLRNTWIPGINLYTYHKMGAVLPARADVAARVRNYKLPKGSPLTDLSIWNFILSGDKITLIDHDSVNNSKGHRFPVPKDPKIKLNQIAKIIKGK